MDKNELLQIIQSIHAKIEKQNFEDYNSGLTKINDNNELSPDAKRAQAVNLRVSYASQNMCEVIAETLIELGIVNLNG